MAVVVGLATISSANASQKLSSIPNNKPSFNNADDLLKAQNRIHKSRFVDEQIAHDVRLKAMADYAKQIAMQVAMRTGMQNINRVLDTHARQLDAIYDFQPLMIHGKVVPPVVTEAVDLYNQSGAMQIRLTDRVYDIVAQARITSTQPNWRNYLHFPNEYDAFNDYIYLTSGMKPQTAVEKKVWQQATKEGWNIGIAQSNTVLLEAMDRLNRDYIGMIRFHRLVAEGKLDMPALSSYQLSDKSTGTRLLMGEKLLQITSLPQFKQSTNEPDTSNQNHVLDQIYIKDLQELNHDVVVEKQDDNTLVAQQINKAQQDISVIDEPDWLKTDIQETQYTRSVITRKIIDDVAYLNQQNMQ